MNRLVNVVYKNVIYKNVMYKNFSTNVLKNTFSLNHCKLLDAIDNKKEQIYNYQYDNNGNNFTLKINEYNIYTLLELHNLHNIQQIKYLDSYLYFFRKYHNNVILYLPDLKKISHEISHENMARHNNKFIIYGFNKITYSEVHDINNYIGRNWFFY